MQRKGLGGAAVHYLSRLGCEVSIIIIMRIYYLLTFDWNFSNSPSWTLKLSIHWDWASCRRDTEKASGGRPVLGPRPKSGALATTHWWSSIFYFKILFAYASTFSAGANDFFEEKQYWVRVLLVYMETYALFSITPSLSFSVGQSSLLSC